MDSMRLEQLHQDFVFVTKKYHRSEAELLDHTQIAERVKLYLYKGYSSMWKYLTEGLGLSESVCGNVLNVARMAKKVPRLKEEIRKGSFGLSKGRKIVPALKKVSDDVKKADEWIAKATNEDTRQLEAEVAEISDAPRRKDKVRAVSRDRFRVTVEVSREELEQLRRVITLESTRKKDNVTEGEAIVAALQTYIEKNDPIQKAERSQKRKQAKKNADVQNTPEPSKESPAHTMELVTGQVESRGHSNKRNPLPQAVIHAVNLRDKRRCRFCCPDGKQCSAERHLHYHHIVPVSQGGDNSPENIITLCSAHHRLIHEDPNTTHGFARK